MAIAAIVIIIAITMEIMIAIVYSCMFKPDNTPTQPSSFKCVCFEGHAADLPNNDSSFVQRARVKQKFGHLELVNLVKAKGG